MTVLYDIARFNAIVRVSLEWFIMIRQYSVSINLQRIPLFYDLILTNDLILINELSWDKHTPCIVRNITIVHALLSCCEIMPINFNHTFQGYSTVILVVMWFNFPDWIWMPFLKDFVSCGSKSDVVHVGFRDLIGYITHDKWVTWVKFCDSTFFNTKSAVMRNMINFNKSLWQQFHARRDHQFVKNFDIIRAGINEPNDIL